MGTQKHYNTTTASLKATVADIRNLDVKNIKVKGEKIISKIKHPLDNREVVTENDLWGSYAEIVDGEVIFHNDFITNPDEMGCQPWNENITSIKNNKGYVGDVLYANIELEKIRDHENIFSYHPNLIEFDGKLSSIVSGNRAFYGSQKLMGAVTFDGCGHPESYSFNAELPLLKEGSNMFGLCYAMTSFTSELPKLEKGDSMFYDDYKLVDFTSDMPKLSSSYCMFCYCSSLKGKYIEGNCGIDSYYTFDNNLDSLNEGQYMFKCCSSLTKFESKLPNLTIASLMFSESGLKTFDVDLPSLVHGYSMFSDCKDLISFTGDLSALSSGASMFEDCESLTTFVSDLSSLEYADGMFTGCRLDTDSLTHIANTIKEHKTGIHTIGIGLGHPLTSKDIDLINEINDKGWGLYVEIYNNGQFEGSECWSSTLEENGETSTAVPYYAKPVKVEEKYAKLVNEDGDFFRISGGHYIIGEELDSFGIFLSREHAIENICSSLNLRPYDRLTKEEEIETA